MTPTEHYAEAERLIAEYKPGAVALVVLTLAQIHATLACYRGDYQRPARPKGRQPVTNLIRALVFLFGYPSEDWPPGREAVAAYDAHKEGKS